VIAALRAAEAALRLENELGLTVRRDAPLAPYTSARIGGPADFLVEVRSAGALEAAVRLLWESATPFLILGGGSNALISDRGVRGVVLLNRARAVRFEAEAESPSVWAESGAMLGTIARLAAERGLAGLEWAATVPGTLGGAIVGNAGAYGGDIAGCLMMAEILQHNGLRESWRVERLDYGYRTSALKGHGGRFAVLAGCLRLEPSTPEACRAKMQELAERREASQPGGASMGSMFKNPPGDSAGRLIEAVGLKGSRVGGARISEKHANFFLNEGTGTAADVLSLVRTAQEKVAERFGVRLDLEIELLGDWTEAEISSLHWGDEA